MISSDLRILLVFLASFFVAIFTLPKLAHIARRLGLLDQPNHRKIHNNPRPLVGGIGMVVAVTFTSLLFIPIEGLRGYFLGLAILLFVGFLDDFRELGHRQKFLAQILAAAMMIYFSKVVLSSFGDLFGVGEIAIPGGMYVIWMVTIFSVVGVINAVNLIDGLDGLAGGISFIAFIFFAVHASLANDHTLMLLNLALAGALLGFLRFNWHPSVLFMGDAGSLCLGFSLAFMALALTQGEASTTRPVAALLILAVPITDTLIVMFKRILRGRSPFVADKYHLHHIFLRYGMSRSGSVRVILALSVLMGGLSLLQPAYGISDAVLFGMFGIYFVIYLASSFYIIGLFRYSLKVRKKRAGKLSANYLLRLIFGTFDVFQIFRKSRRYAVNLGMKISIVNGQEVMRGRVLNISQTGCMVKVKGEDPVPEEVELEIGLTCGGRMKIVTIVAEHLWGSSHEGNVFHGFRFTKFSGTDEPCLIEYLEQIAGRQPGDVQSVTA